MGTRAVRPVTPWIRLSLSRPGQPYRCPRQRAGGQRRADGIVPAGVLICGFHLPGGKHLRHAWDRGKHSMAGTMTAGEPWDVRHIYTTAEPAFEPYLAVLGELLITSQRAGWIGELRDCPVDEPAGIFPALLTSALGELVIVDFHGWVVEDGPWLGSTTAAGVLLRDLPANSWSASIIFLTGCVGGTPEFAAHLDRVLTHRTSIVSHFGETGMRDNTPIDLVNAVLGEAAGGDVGDAFNAVDRALYNRSYRRDQAWMVAQRGPGLR